MSISIPNPIITNPRRLAVSLTSYSITLNGDCSPVLLPPLCPQTEVNPSMCVVCTGWQLPFSLSVGTHSSPVIPRPSSICIHLLLACFPLFCFLWVWVMPRPRGLYFTLLCLGRIHPSGSLVLTFSPSRQPLSTAPITPKHPFPPISALPERVGAQGKRAFCFVVLPRCPPQCPAGFRDAHLNV